MFKFAKSLLERGIQREEEIKPPVIHDPIMNIPEEGPEMVIGETVTVIGKIIFQREIRVDGVFEGELEASGKIVIGPGGYVKADLDLDEADISGKVEGNITVKSRVVLRGNAEVTGNITAPRLSVDEGVSITGQLLINSRDAKDVGRDPFL